MQVGEGVKVAETLELYLTAPYAGATGPKAQRPQAAQDLHSTANLSLGLTVTRSLSKPKLNNGNATPGSRRGFDSP
jgi:hypothetical protein